MTNDTKKLWEWEERAVNIVEADGTVRRSTARRRRHLQSPRRFAWDDWQERARAAGVAAGLAQLGRSLMREADQHGWREELQRECGWDDDGAAMIALALSKPDEALARWSRLLDTDGERVAPDDDQVDDNNDDNDGRRN